MSDTDCVAFLQWALPRLQMRWPGFRRVRRQVCKRLGRRAKALGLRELGAYRRYLEECPSEWAALDELCRITISRFYRDRAVFDLLRHELLPHLCAQATAGGEGALRIWSAGCASGEEPYTLAILWRLELERRYAGLALRLTATDADPFLLERARRGCYGAGTLRELPDAWREAAFRREGERYCLRARFRAGIEFRREDIRHEQPEGCFQLILCRNLVFTYFDAPLQRALAARIAERLAPGGLLVLGGHEQLPTPLSGFAPAAPGRGELWRRVAAQ